MGSSRSRWLINRILAAQARHLREAGADLGTNNPGRGSIRAGQDEHPLQVPGHGHKAPLAGFDDAEPLRANDHETSTPRKFTLEGDR